MRSKQGEARARFTLFTRYGSIWRVAAGMGSCVTAGYDSTDVKRCDTVTCFQCHNKLHDKLPRREMIRGHLTVTPHSISLGTTVSESVVVSNRMDTGIGMQQSAYIEHTP